MKRKNIPSSYDATSDVDLTAWVKIRGKVLKYDGYRCQRCGIKFTSGNGLSVHHIIPRNEGGQACFSNLITLCYSCHDYVEIVGNLRNRAAIVGSWEGPRKDKTIPHVRLADIARAEKEKREPFTRPSWHAWVYGGQRKENCVDDRNYSLKVIGWSPAHKYVWKRIWRKIFGRK